MLVSLIVILVAGQPPPFPGDDAVICGAKNPLWPTYHVINNVTKHADSTLTLEPLNDANAVFLYKGIYHVMNQAGGGNWTHVISNDLIHWKHIDDALGRGTGNEWDDQGPCDGTASFPALGGVHDGTVPIIMYGPDCGKPLKPHKLGDTPRVEPATPKDPADPYLRDWVKTPNGPVVFDGVPCSFPGRVWKSKVGEYWNMVCAYDGQSPWARYTTTDPTLMTWKVADKEFTKGAHEAAVAGALFHKIPGAPATGPQFMINSNTGSAFYLGTYDPQTEAMTVTSELQTIDSGHSYHWAASGNDGPDPESDTGRLLTVAWLSAKGLPSVISLIREMAWCPVSQRLITFPVAEYANLRTTVFVANATFDPVTPGTIKTLPVPAAAGGSLDVEISFDANTWEHAHSGFGVAVRAGPTSVAAGSPTALNFSVSAPDPGTGTRVAVGRINGKVDGTVITVDVLRGETLDVRILVDGPWIEIFLMGGRAAASIGAGGPDPTMLGGNVHIFNGGTAGIAAHRVSAYGMGCGWVGGDELPKPMSVV